MTRRGGSDNISSPLAAVALLLLLLLVCCCSLHGAAAARLLPAAGVPPLVHQEDGAVKAVGAADGLALHQERAAGNGGDELSISEMMGAEPEEACEEANNDECLQRRLLRDAHLDYIYTQHKGKP